jgi:hypothetical protein
VKVERFLLRPRAVANYEFLSQRFDFGAGDNISSQVAFDQ